MVERERAHLLVPHAGVRDARVQEDHRPALARHLVPEPGAVHVEERHGA